MNDYTVILKLRVRGMYANPSQWDWDYLLDAGENMELISIELKPGKEEEDERVC